MHPKVRDASGHTANFNDPLIDDKNTGERFRADKLIEERIETFLLDSRKNPQKLSHISELDTYLKQILDKQESLDIAK